MPTTVTSTSLPWRLALRERFRPTYAGRFVAWVLRALRRVLTIELFLIQRRPLVAGQVIPAAFRERFTVGQLDAEALLEHCDDPGLDLSRRFIEGALARGELCFGVLDGDRLVAYHWHAVEIAPLDPEIEIGMRASHTYGYKMFTHPAYRGQRLQLHCIRYADDVLVRRGYTHAMGYVRYTNASSRRLLGRTADMEWVGWTGRITLLGHAFVLRTLGARRYGYSCTRVPAIVGPPSLVVKSAG